MSSPTSRWLGYRSRKNGWVSNNVIAPSRARASQGERIRGAIRVISPKKPPGDVCYHMSCFLTRIWLGQCIRPVCSTSRRRMIQKSPWKSRRERQQHCCFRFHRKEQQLQWRLLQFYHAKRNLGLVMIFFDISSTRTLQKRTIGKLNQCLNAENLLACQCFCLTIRTSFQMNRGTTVHS